jgi:hypothetical protein
MPVRIEDDCWLGIDSVVMRGLTIGRGYMIVANSVVNSDVPPYSVVAGAPARVINKRLDLKRPCEVAYDRSNTVPYFYIGFYCSTADRETAAQSGGIFAGNEFAIAMAAGVGGDIVIRAKAIINLNMMLRHAGDTHPLSKSFTSLKFRACPNQSGTLEFHVDGPPNNVPVLALERVTVT